jgi:peptide/nickel transport system permease protein
MYAYVLQRLFAAVPVLLVVALFVFLLLHITPGDPAIVIAGDLASAEELGRIRRQLGLDQPLHLQFAGWIWRVAQGDLGQSIFSKMPVTELIAQRLEPTILLAATTCVVAIAVAIPLGVAAAARAGTWIDRALMAVSVLGFSVPVFVLGYGLIQVFAVSLDLLPVQGYAPLARGTSGTLRSLALPSVTLGLVYFALIARMTRAAMLDVLTEDYIRTARAKGVAPGSVLGHHALRNAAVPIVTTIGMGVALLLGGVVVTETVFNIPGLGRLTVDAILRRDYPVIQGVILLFSAIYVFVNLAVDLAYTAIDPRIRY